MKLFDKFKKKDKKKKLSKREKRRINKVKKEKRLEKRITLKNKIKSFNLSDFFGGMAVGIANIIPGVSGGTMLVIFNLFDKIIFAISDIFKRKTDTRKQSLFLIFKVGIGAALGIILFAKILGFTLEYFEAETIFWFMGLILFSVPIVIKTELDNERFSISSFIIGILLIFVLQFLKSKGIINDTNVETNLIHYAILVGLGLIGGATMIFPGISGSMILLILGKYELIRSYIDNLTKFDKTAIISLSIFGIGVILGIILFAKLTSYLLKNHRGKIVSLIVGFIIASSLILPFNIENKVIIDSKTICACAASFVLGGIVIYYINQMENKKSL